MKVLLPVKCDAEFAEVPEVAVLELDAARVQTILQLMDEMIALEKKFGSIYGVERFDYACDYFDSLDDLKDLSDNQHDGVVDGHIVSLSEDFEKGHATTSTETDTAFITKDSVKWTAYLKHSNILIYTVEVDRPFLESQNKA